MLERLGQLRAGGRLASLLQAHREDLVAGMTTVLRQRLAAARPLIRRGSLASVPSSGTSPRPSGTHGPGLYSTCHFVPMLCSNADRKQPAQARGWARARGLHPGPTVARVPAASAQQRCRPQSGRRAACHSRHAAAWLACCQWLPAR